MPATKPTGLQVRHATRSERTARAESDAALTPSVPLTSATPAALRGHAYASRLWVHLIKLYSSIDAVIVTSLDRELLVRYCLLEEETRELMSLRKTIAAEWRSQLKSAKKIKPSADNLKDWVRMWEIVNALFQRFQGMDARLDGKRKLLVQVEQSLYLTPRSRAGVAPTEKADEPEPDEIEKLLNDSE